MDEYYSGKKIIPFNRPYLTGKEIKYIYQAVNSGKISGNGLFTQKCQIFFETRFGFKKVLLTTSCTDALEMCALLADIQPGDEVIVPSYTFVSSALAFVRQGAKIIFADSRKDHPGIDEDLIEPLITSRTRVIVPVHYAGVACDMDKIMRLATRYNLLVIEDAAQAIDSFYKGQPLGGIGHMAAFSFHETKNINSGEGGMIVINDEKFIKRSEIIWEKGTNRSEFFRGEVSKYGWVDTGSSFLPSEIIAAYLYAQLETLDKIQKKRKNIWGYYNDRLKIWVRGNHIRLPQIPEYATNNGHMYYLIFDDVNKREEAIQKLKKRNILAVSHYISLHSSPYYKKKHDGRTLVESDRYTDTLLRLPFYYELRKNDLDLIIQTLTDE
jgi:dTDP-4-amino-4,6-dideoxygalactose transaminase